MKARAISATGKPWTSSRRMSGRWGMKSMPLHLCAGRVGSADVAATVSYPSIDVSLKDGFAVKSSDVDRAERSAPVRLNVVGSSFAGVPFGGRIRKGEAVRLCSGSPIPDGADAVVSGEFCAEGSSGDVYHQGRCRSGPEYSAGRRRGGSRGDDHPEGGTDHAGPSGAGGCGGHQHDPGPPPAACGDHQRRRRGRGAR